MHSMVVVLLSTALLCTAFQRWHSRAIYSSDRCYSPRIQRISEVRHETYDSVPRVFMSSNDEEDGAETMDFDEEFEHLGSIDFIDSAEEEEEEFELAIDEDNLVPEDEDNSEASSSVEDKKANSSPKRISMSTLSLQERRELLKKRQLKARMKSGGQGGSLDEDPLRSSSPNVEIFPYIEPFTKLFVALAYVDDNPSEPTKLNQNSEGDSQSVMRFQARNLAWKYHMQWVRRSAIVPSHLQTSKIAWEYTLLSDDCMRPVGNVIGILANTSSDVLSYLEKEPLSKCGAFINADSGVDGWQVFEMDRVESGDSLEDEFIDEDDQIERGVGDGRGSLCYDLRKPYLHIAMSESGYSEKSMQSCITYHSDAPILSLYEEDNSQKDGGFGRVATFGKLHPIGSKDSKGAKPVGRLLLFNAKSNKDAKQYVMDDPLMKKSTDMDAVYSINMQDIDGFHQLMPRSFGQRTQLDKIHAQDPEDLLSIEYPPIPSLPNHHKDNLAVLSLLKENALSYKYTRLRLRDKLPLPRGLSARERLIAESEQEARIAEQNFVTGQIQQLRLDSNAGATGSMGEEDAILLESQEE